MSDLMRICLYDAGPTLIVPCSSDFLYYNQTCGTNCVEMNEEGVVIPLADMEDFEDQLGQLFAEGTDGKIDEELGRRIDKIFTVFPQTRGIQVDWSKFDESWEAWLHVLISDHECAPYEGLKDVSAILTWCNSD